ncbi:hypothetical protein DFH07DRAFT_863630, partial [Mycena maculata]
MALYRSFGHPSKGDPPPEPSGSICGFYSNFFPILPCCFQLRNDLPASFRFRPVAPAPPPNFFRNLPRSHHLSPSDVPVCVRTLRSKNLWYQFFATFPGLWFGLLFVPSLPVSFNWIIILLSIYPHHHGSGPGSHASRSRTLHSGTFRFSVFFGVLTKLFLQVFFHVVLPSSDFPLRSGLSGTSGPVSHAL